MKKIIVVISFVFILIGGILSCSIQASNEDITVYFNG